MFDLPSCNVSVIIPAYCAEKHISRAVQSILRQTVFPKELIVVDDGSDDGTSKIIETYKQIETPIKIITLYQSNQGAGAARNYAIKYATSKYVAFLDADDEWLPSKLERSVLHIERGNYNLVGHNILMVKEGKQTKNDIFARYEKASDGLFHGLYRRGFLSTSTIVTPLEQIHRFGGFDVTLKVGQDFDLWLKMLEPRDARILVFNEYLAKYHVRNESITRNTDNRLSCTIRVARRHAPILRDHKGSPIASLWFRLLAIHHEAIRGHWESKQYISVFRVIMRFFRVIILETTRLARGG